MSDIPRTGNEILVPGCPEAPAQQVIALYIAHQLRTHGADLLIAGNPPVLSLLKVSDPDKHYIWQMMVLERCIEEIVEKRLTADSCIVCAHNDAAIASAATMRHLLPDSRLVVIIFGKDPEPPVASVDFPCGTIVEKAVHNPMQLKGKVNGVSGWAALRT
jgi:threonyl-tRNA synthetase